MNRNTLFKKAFEGGLIAPSILSADFSCLSEEIKSVEKEGTQWIHIDVMDGHFVDNLTFGPALVQSIRPKTKSILDCHLMVQEPKKWINVFASAGADCITIHIESGKNQKALLKKIRSLGCLAGISIRPSTPLSKITSLLDHVDLVLVMSVQPGFGGQKFMPIALKKMQTLVALRKNRMFLIEVDGGVHKKNIALTRTAGADIMVAGSAIFGKKNRKQAIQQLRKAIDHAN